MTGRGAQDGHLHCHTALSSAATLHYMLLNTTQSTSAVCLQKPEWCGTYIYIYLRAQTLKIRSPCAQNAICHAKPHPAVNEASDFKAEGSPYPHHSPPTDGRCQRNLSGSITGHGCSSRQGIQQQSSFTTCVTIPFLAYGGSAMVNTPTCAG